MWKLPGVGVLAFGLCLSVTIPCGKYLMAAAQPQQPVLRVQVDLQSIAVRVTDKQGNDVRGLSAEDFTISDDGRPQKIAFFGAQNVPTSLGVLVDSSGSMDPNSKLGSAKAVATQFMRSGRSEDEIFAMDFTDQFGPFQQLTQVQLAHPSSVPLVSGTGEGSALYDAIATALCHLRGSKNLRQAVVVITNGVDQHSRVTLDQLLGLVRSSRVQLFMIAWHSKPEYNLSGHVEKRLTLVSGHDIDNPAIVFDRLTKESGAESFFPTSEEDLLQALNKVSDLLQAQYTVAYYPESDSKKFRRIQVKVRRPGLNVTSRRGVGSDSGAQESVKFVEGTCTVSPEAHPYPYESKVMLDNKRKIYRENFSNSRSGWPNREGSRYTQGGYELSNLEASKIPPIQGMSAPLAGSSVSVQQNVVAAYGPWWTDFHASVIVNASLAMNLTPAHSVDSRSLAQDRPAAGLVFRLSQQGYYALLLSGNRGNKEFWLKLVKREYQSNLQSEIVPWTRVDVPNDSDDGIKLSVESIGSMFILFVNDQSVKRVRDDTFQQGYVGFVISGAGRAIFRDLAVEEIP